MKFTAQALPGVFLVQGEPFRDERGAFRRHFCIREFEKHGIVSQVAQANISENVHAYTLRGFHYQVAPYAEAKTISVVVGAVYDIVVDLRESSPTYLKWVALELRARDCAAVHIPAGCANAFLSLESNTILQYFSSEFYMPEAERGIRFDDPLFKFKWPTAPSEISKKDQSWPNYIPS